MWIIFQTSSPFCLQKLLLTNKMPRTNTKCKKVETSQREHTYKREKRLRNQSLDKIDDQKLVAAFENSSEKGWELTSNVTIDSTGAPNTFRMRLKKH